MAVVVIEAGRVSELYRDVETPADAVAKYPGLSGKKLVQADQSPGMLYAGGNFTRPAPTPRQKPENATARAVRKIADANGSPDWTEILAILNGA